MTFHSLFVWRALRLSTTQEGRPIGSIAEEIGVLIPLMGPSAFPSQNVCPLVKSFTEAWP